jgi:hypothetical protein
MSGAISGVADETRSRISLRSCGLRSLKTVVPAKAGTHTPCVVVLAMRQRPSLTIHARGYGSRPSPGRRGWVSQYTAPHSRDTLRPSFANSFAPKEKRGRREDRVRAAPAVSCAKAVRKNAHEHTGSAEAVRPSLRNGFTAYLVLSPVRPKLACHRHRADTSAQLDTSHRGVRTTRFCRPLQPRSSIAAFASIAPRAQRS